MKKIKTFDPTQYSLKFNFTKDTCNKINTGICPLDTYKDQLNRNDYDFSLFRKEYPKCVSMYYAMKNNKIVALLPRIHKFKCGHYMCDDGQHRICIAIRMGLTLTVEYVNDYVVDDDCWDCKGWSG